MALTLHLSPGAAAILADPDAAKAAYEKVESCGCSLANGFCGTHQFMMSEINVAWRSGSSELRAAIWALSDGYGEPGYVPEQGYDWSGIRDSSTAAIEAMWKVVHS